MATYITQADVNQLLHFAALSAAQKVGIAEAEWEPYNKLVAAVHAASATLGAALDAFTNAYVEWFEFGAKLEAQGKSGNMSQAESAQHMRLMQERDNTRTAFIAALKTSA